MKVIDLLNKIANTKDYKDIPKKVKISTGTLKEEYRIWVWDGIWYIYEEDGEDVCICTEKLDLNDRVEVIEEAEKIEKLEHMNSRDYLENRDKYLSTKGIALDIETLRNWMNKILDHINEMSDKDE